MEKFNFNGGENILKSICWILSYLFWLLFSINNLASLKWMYKENHIWCTGTTDDVTSYAPLQMTKIWFYIVYNIMIIMTLIGFAVYIFKTLIKPEKSVADGMMGKFSQFHFFPILCCFILSLLNEIVKDDGSNIDDLAYTGLSFSLIGTIAMIFIYINTNVQSQDWWVEYTLNKGTFSCLVILLWYNFFYSMYAVGIVKGDPPKNFDKNCGITFSLFVGIGALVFAFIYKDIFICFLNILIYFGMANKYFSIGTTVTSTKDLNENGDGAIDLIILVCSIGLFIYLLVEIIRTENNKIKNLILTIGQAQNQVIVKVNANSEQINMLASGANLTSKN